MQPIMTLVQITNYTSPNCTDRPQVNVHCIEHFSPFTSFEQLALALEKQSCPENFHCIGYTFHIQDFEQLALALKNRRFPEFTVRNVYFLLFRSFE